MFVCSPIWNLKTCVLVFEGEHVVIRINNAATLIYE